jgi:hypothetical protein
MDRKKFLLTTAGAAPGLLFAGRIGKSLGPGMIRESDRIHASGLQEPDPRGQTPEPFKTELVKEFVIAGHGNLVKTQSMVKDYPNLVFSKFDWGTGDFEGAIEGAGHMGNRAIAEFLIDSGSRVTLFVLAMLGRTDLVRPVLEAYPKLIFANGPHGFTMLHHAKLAGKEGEALYSYLQEKGLKETWVKIK